MSARDVLREAMAVAMLGADDLHAEDEPCPDCQEYRNHSRKALDALLAHPVELLALLAEPKLCATCRGSGKVYPESMGMVALDTVPGYDPRVRCKPCHGSGSVAVDVLDLLVQAGLVEQVTTGDGMATRTWGPLEERVTSNGRPVYAAKDGTP